MINQLVKASLFVCLFSLSSISYCQTEEFFSAARKLSVRSQSIGDTIGKHMNNIDPSKTADDERADISLLMSIAETGGTCALLSGNLIGGAGLMDKNTRSGFIEMVNLSVSSCIKFIDFRLQDLNYISKHRQNRPAGELAADISAQLLQMRDEFTTFINR